MTEKANIIMNSKVPLYSYNGVPEVLCGGNHHDVVHCICIMVTLQFSVVESTMTSFIVFVSWCSLLWKPS